MKALLVLAFSLLCFAPAWGQKLNFDFGYYTIEADPSSNTGSSDKIKLSGLGSYSLSGEFDLAGPFEIEVGYTVFFSKVVQGDMGFGPDFSLVYFPLNHGSYLKSESPQVQYREIEQWRPFADFSFHQRQFQSAQSSFSGFGAGAGLEYQYTTQTSLRAQLRSMSLIGPSSTKFNYTDLLIGLQLHFQ